MMRKSLLMMLILFALPAQANDVWRLRQRLDRAVDKPAQMVNAYAEKIICKTERKPICYANATVIEQGYALVRVFRPEGQSYFVLFQLKEGQWHPIYSRKIEKMTLANWKADKAKIGDTLAARLIQKLNAIR